ncbi:MAG: AI-2E family transporter, partial [Pseudomonadota bacterium]
MTVGEQLRWWGLGLFVLLVVLWFLASPLLPFILGAAIAYLADPLADRLERAGLSRMMATVTLSVGIAGFFFLVALFLVPAVIDQVRSLIAGAPDHIRSIQSFISNALPVDAPDDGMAARMISMLQGRAEEWSVRV